MHVRNFFVIFFLVEQWVFEDYMLWNVQTLSSPLLAWRIGQIRRFRQASNVLIWIVNCFQTTVFWSFSLYLCKNLGLHLPVLFFSFFFFFFFFFSSFNDHTKLCREKRTLTNTYILFFCLLIFMVGEKKITISSLNN